MKKPLCILFLFFVALNGYSQNVPNRVSYYPFDACLVEDVEANYANMSFNGNPECVCGPGSDAFNFDGIDDFAQFDRDINEIFEDDFSISFYFRLNPSSEPMDILSFRPSCTRDSSFSIRYIPASNEITVELAENVGSRAVTMGQYDQNRCWNWLVYTRSVTEHKFYLNGIKVDEDDSDRQLMLNDTVFLSIGNSPCVGISDVRFEGSIDELKIFNRALDESEIPLLNLGFDEIISNDTTIFLGDAIPINAGETCANSFAWSPTTGLSDPFSLMPNASPTTTTTYTISYNYSNCVSTDQITINVLDSTNVDCNQLLLPSAFTPNGDGLNDDYGISNVFIIDQLEEFKIMDRWGDTVFKTTNKNETWDGSFQGKRMQPGTLVYQVKYRCGNSNFVKVGSFSIIR